jgi:RNA ligase
MKSFDELVEGLRERVERGLIREVEDPAHKGQLLYNYTDSCVYEKIWDEFTLMARGLVLDMVARRVVATPFVKFFNWQEIAIDGGALLPYQNDPAVLRNTSFEVFEKMDVSLIIIFWDSLVDGGKWRCCTRGSFVSEQALWAQDIIDAIPREIVWFLDKEATYLCEAVYRENRIVVNYGDYSGLVLLGVYGLHGEWDSEMVVRAAEGIGFRSPKKIGCAEIEDLLEVAQILSGDEEGFVVRFSNGLRVKIKRAEYCRLHRLVSHLTPISVWEAMVAGDDMEGVRRELPEEFWGDFDCIYGLLNQDLQNLKIGLEEFATRMNGLDDKQLGLYMQKSEALVPEGCARFVFAWRKKGGWKGLMGMSRLRESVYKEIRPAGNVLLGYTSTSGMKRVLSEG